MVIKHILKTQQFSRDNLEGLFDRANQIDGIISVPSQSSVRFLGKIMATQFYEPSTRTRLSFEAAMLRWGGQVLSTENAKEFSSAAKGETLEDSIRTIGQYCDVIVLRHYESGAAERAARVSNVPIINAGDGPGQHPTQAILDAYTIQKEIGRIDGIQVAMVGDLLNGRTVRSLTYLLSKFSGVKIWFVAPDVVRIGQDIKDHLAEHSVEFVEEDNLEKVASLVDVVYMTRIQKERFGDRIGDFESAYGKYILDGKLLSLMKAKSIVMHPLPRVNEITIEVDGDPRAAYFRQVRNGMIIRMALLEYVLS